MIEIKPFKHTDKEYRKIAAIYAAIFESPADPIEEWRHDDERWDKAYPFFRDWVLRDGEIVGFVETFQSQYAYHPEKSEFRVFVDPEKEAADIRPKVLTHTLERLQNVPLIAIKSGMLDNKLEAMRFFADYGFKRVTVEQLSKLTLATFESEKFRPILAKMHDAGIELLLLRQLQQRDADWRTLLYDLYITVNPDIPTTGEKRYEGFDKWCETRIAGPTFDPDNWFVAVKDGQYIAQSNGTINREGDSPIFYTGMTTVRREWRRKGVATALKLTIIDHLNTQGIAEIHTSNDAQNPMYQLNLAMGFEPMPSWVRVEKSLV